MTDDTLIRLRRVNPVPHDPAAPPIDRVMALIAGAERDGAPRPRTARRWTGALLPSLGVAVAVAVTVVALIAIGHGVQHRSGVAGTHRSAHVPHASATPSAPAVTLPAGGMAGVVQLWGSVMSPSGQGVVSFEQCNPCTRVQRLAEWSAATTDAGASWTIKPQPFYLFDPQFGGGQDVWGDGQSRGTIVNGVWASHDGGRTFRQVPLPVNSNEPGAVSARDGEVWAAAPDCARVCRMTILHGSSGASGSLQPTRSQPAPSVGQANLIAAGRGTAYVEVIRPHAAQHYVTHDGGRSWSVTGTACNNGVGDEALTADGPDSLWEQCLVHRNRFVLAHSANGGRTWTAYPLPLGLGGLFELRPVGGGTVWAITDNGIVLRTLDGGRSWRSVLNAGPRAVLMAASASTVLVVRAIGRGHAQHHSTNTNLVAFRTSDGGAHWLGTTIALPRH